MAGEMQDRRRRDDDVAVLGGVGTAGVQPVRGLEDVARGDVGQRLGADPVRLQPVEVAGRVAAGRLGLDVAVDGVGEGQDVRFGRGGSATTRSSRLCLEGRDQLAQTASSLSEIRRLEGPFDRLAAPLDAPIGVVMGAPAADPGSTSLSISPPRSPWRDRRRRTAAAGPSRTPCRALCQDLPQLAFGERHDLPQVGEGVELLRLGHRAPPVYVGKRRTSRGARRPSRTRRCLCTSTAASPHALGARSGSTRSSLAVPGGCLHRRRVERRIGYGIDDPRHGHQPVGRQAADGLAHLVHERVAVGRNG